MIIFLSLSPICGRMLHMAFTNWMGKSLKPLCLARHLAINSQFCEFEWFEWVFQDEIAAYPNDHSRLGRYLGPRINIGPTLAKIIKENGQINEADDQKKMTN